MKLIDLLAVINIEAKKDFEVKNICLDSREAKDGSLYLCFNKEYLTKEILKKDIVVLTPFKCTHKKIISIKNLENIYEKLIHQFFDNITEKVCVIGVTGTNGKTTTAYSLYSLFNKLGQPSLYIGTLGAFYLGKEVILKNTTPSLIENLTIIKEAYDLGIKYVFMEVSSHALVQNRVKGINFIGAVFTNLTQDHLDYHHNMEEYAIAKKNLFDSLSNSSFAIVNIDDSYNNYIVKDCKAKIISYGLENNVNAVSNLKDKEAISFNFEKGKLKSSFIGRFNVYNLLAVFYTALELKQDSKQILKIIPNLPHVNGRMDIIKYKKSTIIVDFAHSPDAFKKVFEEVSKMKYKKLKVLFGCGGNRDAGKRSIMGKIADDYADLIFLTNDNARDEDEKEIIEQIKKGIINKNKIIEQVNREKAIIMALDSLKKHELLLILGRGHESHLTIKGQKIPLNDKDVVTSWIQTH